MVYAKKTYVNGPPCQPSIEATPAWDWDYAVTLGRVFRAPRLRLGVTIASTASAILVT